jgi:hypothetical protein
MALLAICTACVSASDADSTRNPFRSKWEAEGGLAAVFEGLAAGHTRGGISTFRLQLINRSSEPLEAAYCVVLTDGSSSNQLLSERRNLAAESAVSVEIVAVVPEGISAGAYELGLLLVDRGYVGTTIYVDTRVGSPAPPLANPPTDCPESNNRGPAN